MTGDWRDDAACLVPTADFFTPVPREQRALIRDFCESCPVALACLEVALVAEGKASAHGRYGVFGGLTPNQRAHLSRRIRKEQK